MNKGFYARVKALSKWNLFDCSEPTDQTSLHASSGPSRYKNDEHHQETLFSTSFSPRKNHWVERLFLFQLA
jgi:hypothetical protein